MTMTATTISQNYVEQIFNMYIEYLLMSVQFTNVYIEIPQFLLISPIFKKETHTHKDTPE